MRDIADLTDWQVEHLYLRAAAERDKDSKSQDAGDGVDPFAEGLPTREEFIAAMFPQGQSVEHWNKVYDQLLAEQESRAK